MKMISIVLLLVTAFLSFKHGWDAFRPASPDQARMLADLGLTRSFMPYFGVFSFVIGSMLLFPQTFFVSNVLHSFAIVLIMSLSLRAGNVRMALIEIPFLAIPLLLIWLKYPFKN